MLETTKKNNKIALASDHGGYSAKQCIIKYLVEKGISFDDLGAHSDESSDYPDFAHLLAQSIENNTYSRGIAICGTGNGIAITLNKYQEIRAALCWDKNISKLARLHNDANILVLPGRFLDEDDMIDILDSFFETQFEGGRHERRIKKMSMNN